MVSRSSAYKYFPLEINKQTGEPFLRLLPPHSNIILTPPRATDEDISAAVEILNDMRVVRWLSGPPYPYTAEHGRVWFEITAKRSKEIMEEIEAAEPNAFIGGCPVGVIREIKEDGTEVFLGDCSINAWGFEDVGDEDKRRRLINENEKSIPPLKEWSIGGMYLKISMHDHKDRPANNSYFLDYLAPTHHGKGIMSSALKRLLEKWAIPRMGARRISAVALEGNIGSVRVFEKNGFLMEKTLPDWKDIPKEKGGGKVGLHVLRKRFGLELLELQSRMKGEDLSGEVGYSDA